MIHRHALRTVTLAIYLLAGTSAQAHDLWLTTAGLFSTSVVVNYGHPGDRPPAFADKLVELVAISPERTVSLLDGLDYGRIHGAPIVRSKPFEAGIGALLAARYDNGFWIRAPDGQYRNATARLRPDAAGGLWSGKFAKTLTGPGAPWDRVLGHEVEIVPLRNPFSLQPGEALPIRVVFQGHALPDAKVEIGDGRTAIDDSEVHAVRTDQAGEASIPITGAGPVLLSVNHRVAPSRTPSLAEADLFAASLYFELRGRFSLRRIW